MAKSKTGGSAFPHPKIEIDEFEYFIPSGGMSLRDWFAGMALQGLIASHHEMNPDREAAAKWSYGYADAMIRKKQE